MEALSKLASSDIFFYYGKSDIELETEADIVIGLSQPKKSMFYARSEGCGVSEYGNFPNTLVMQVMARYDIAKWAAYRNENVSDGNENLPDRRVAISQNSVGFGKNRDELDVDVQYIRFANYKNINKVSIGAT